MFACVYDLSHDTLLHSGLGYLSPNQFEAKLTEKSENHVD